MLALLLLIMNGRRAFIGDRLRNGPLAIGVLVVTLVLSTLAGAFKVRGMFNPPAAVPTEVQPAAPPGPVEGESS